MEQLGVILVKDYLMHQVELDGDVIEELELVQLLQFMLVVNKLLQPVDGLKSAQ